MRDPYMYPDSEVLRSLADIHDVDMLKNMEADDGSFRLSEIVVDDIEMACDFETLCNTRHHIFRDIYEWAGKPRVINIEKAEIVLGEISIEYSFCGFDLMHRVLEQIITKEESVRGRDNQVARSSRINLGNG